MSAAPVSADAGREGRLTEWLLRGFALLAYGFAVTNLALAWWADGSRWTLLLLLIIEGYTLLLVLIARQARMRDMAPLTVAATMYAAFFFVLLEPRGTSHLVPEWAGVALQLCGTLWQFASKLALGRSFGLLPAQRGLVTGGPYRVVRHPIYLGYLVGHVGFLLANASWQNLAVLLLLYAAQVLRMQREEAVLASASEDYRRYQQRVHWRLVPFVY
ncbi:isoprenylcysteine carboxylmethyltransferase family protein [uncultured Piscinibacter sp.]|uniref:methyltransferase family protein n=1 Tax=uncultured Piscinibacter sp. TaxID=1131835 RepID=UPI0026251768|nr:isoprenylcysteine carboxylmethyltransferase family protein [uncultured Piscinibacter sp.]